MALILLSLVSCARRQPMIRDILKADSPDNTYERTLNVSAEDQAKPILAYPSQNRPGTGSPED